MRIFFCGEFEPTSESKYNFEEELESICDSESYFKKNANPNPNQNLAFGKKFNVKLTHTHKKKEVLAKFESES